ncbi:MAG: NifU family protein [Armatimonadota bacterium]|nr:NifU family protein [Armatimonadota bacterium]MCX7778156.1 NifU family protein [Armatimonadota bacterium]MDW8024510.1 NifU family protein [Armatimonadota bacterium]
MHERISEALGEVRHYLRMDGGDVELVNIDEANGIVQVRLVGACSACPFAQFTLQLAIENHLKERVPEVRQVVAVE